MKLTVTRFLLLYILCCPVADTNLLSNTDGNYFFAITEPEVNQIFEQTA
jgi:hypothetical protein